MSSSSKATKSPSSNTSLSELAGDIGIGTAAAMGTVVDTPSIGEPTATTGQKLQLSRQPTKTTVRPSLQYHYEYPLYHQLHTELNIPYDMRMADYELTNFFALASNTSTIKKQLTTVVRIRALDHLHLIDKKKVTRQEFLVWYEVWRGGRGKHNEKINEPYVCLGQDRQFNYDEIKDEDGFTLEYKKAGDFDVFTVPFSAKKLDSILEELEVDDYEQVQWSVTSKGSWGNFTMEEIRDLSLEELDTRGQMGKAGMPTNFLFSKLSMPERLAIETSVNKK